VSGLAWRKSSKCDTGLCVEVAPIGDGVAVRDSRRDASPLLLFSDGPWQAFLGGLREGRLDR
jgi:hypothetical protein